MQERPTKGEVFVNGHNLAMLSRREFRNIAAASGSSFRTSSSFSRTVLENVSFVRRC